MKNAKRKPGRLTLEVVGMIVISLILFAAVSNAVTYKVFSKVIKSQMENLIETIATSSRDFIDGDRLDEFIQTKGEDESFKSSTKIIQTICDNSKFNYIYVVRPDFENNELENGLSVKCSFNNDLETYEPGQISRITSKDYEIAYRKIMNGEITKAFIYRIMLPPPDTTKDHVTGLVPIYNSKKEIAGILCAEAPFELYKQTMKDFVKDFVKWLIIIVLICVIIWAFVIDKRVVLPIIKISKESKRFAQENTVRKNPLCNEIKRNNEIGTLSEYIDLMENQTLNYISDLTKATAEQERISAELDIATKIQESVLPKKYPAFPDHPQIEIKASMTPAKEVGGDFYDWFKIDQDHAGIVIADVSGKGVPAALFMMISKILIKTQAKNLKNPGLIAESVNNILASGNDVEMFVTAWIGVLNIKTGELTYVNAGHENPFIKREKGIYEEIKEKHDFVLAGMEGMKYKESTIKLNPGDSLFIYTDGITEATNASQKLYGTERLTAALNKNPDAEPAQLLENIRSDISSFVQDAPQFDDITMLNLKYC